MRAILLGVKCPCKLDPIFKCLPPTSSHHGVCKTQGHLRDLPKPQYVHHPSYCNIADPSLLGTFLLNNYQQALEILDTRSAVDSALVKVGARDMVMVKEWLKEEEEYLRGLSKEPLEETLEMEYYKLLLNFNASEYVQILIIRIVTYDLQTHTCSGHLGLVQSYGGERW